jgi:Pentapeptide repeats (8 copies)
VTTRASLRADCGRCYALCCVSPAFARSSEFAIDKPAGVPCPNLGHDHRCTIHDRLRVQGFAGCSAYDCFGAGQRLAQDTFGGRDWRTHHEVAAPMMAALPLLRGLHELLWYLGAALAWASSEPVAAELGSAVGEVEEAAASPAGRILEVDLESLRARAAPLLREAGRLARMGYDGPDLADQDLSGHDLRGTDLRGGCLRGARLLGADLRDIDLHLADLLGTDLRGANVSGALIADALFVTQTQVGGADGDRRTTIPDDLERPRHWPA